MQNPATLSERLRKVLDELEQIMKDAESVNLEKRTPF